MAPPLEPDRAAALQVHVDALRGRIDALERWKEAVEAVDLYRSRTAAQRVAEQERHDRRTELRLTRRQIWLAIGGLVVAFGGILATLAVTLAQHG